MADGRINIDTRIQTNNLRRDAQQVNAELDRMSRNISDSSRSSANATARAFDGMNRDSQRAMQGMEGAANRSYRQMQSDAQRSYRGQINSAIDSRQQQQTAAQALANAARRRYQDQSDDAEDSYRRQQQAGQQHSNNSRRHYQSQADAAREAYRQHSDSARDSYVRQEQYADSAYRQQQQAARDSYNAMSSASRAMHAEMRQGMRQSQLAQAAFINDQTRVEYGYYKLAQSARNYHGTTEQFMGQVKALGAEQKRVADAQMAANEMGKLGMIQQAGAMMNLSTQASKISANYDRMGNALLQVNKGGLMVADGLNKMANSGDAAVLALKMLGPTANMKALTDMQNMIIQGQMRIAAVAMASAVTAAVAYSKLWEAAKGPDPSQVFAEQEAALQKYKDAVVSRTTEIVNAWNIFEDAQLKATSPQKLMANLEEQVNIMGQWNDDLNSIAQKAPKEFADYLSSLGPKAAAEVAAVNAMSQPELDRYVMLWQEKTGLARERATTELEGLKQETQAKIKELGDSLTPLGIAFEKFKQVWTEALKPMVEAFSNVVTPCLEFATAVGELVIKFNEAHPKMALIIQGAMMLVPALTLLLSPLAAGIGLWNGILAALNAVWALIGPLVTGLLAMSATVWVVAGALAALAVGFVVLWNNSETFRNGVIAGWEAIKEAALAVWNFILNNAIRPAMAAIGAFVGEKLAQIKQFWDENGAQIMEAARNAWEGIKSIISGVMAVLGPILSVAWEIIKFLVIDTWEAIKNVINGALNIIMGLVKVFTGLFTGDWDKMWEGVKQLFSGALELLWGWFQLWGAGKILKFLGKFVDDFVQWIVKMWDKVKGKWNDVITEIWFFFAQKFEAGKALGKSIMDAIKAVFESVWNAIKGVWNAVIDAIVTFFKNRFNEAKAFTDSIMTGIKMVFSTVWNAIKSVWDTVLNAIKSVLTSVMNGIKGVVSSVMNTIQSIFSSIWNAIKSVVMTVFNAIKSTVQSGMDGAKNIVSNVGNAIKTAFSNIWNGFKNIVTDTFNTVKNGVTNGLNSAVDIVKGFGKTFMNAGKGLINMMADGIKNAASAVTGAIKDIASKARDFLPFSPAKTGPLSDIDKLDFGGPISDSIHRATKGIQVNLASMLELPVIGATGGGMTKQVAQSTINNNNSGGNTNTITVNIDPSNMSEFEQVVDFFNNFKQTKRARG